MVRPVTTSTLSHSPHKAAATIDGAQQTGSPSQNAVGQRAKAAIAAAAAVESADLPKNIQGQVASRLARNLPLDTILNLQEAAGTGETTPPEEPPATDPVVEDPVVEDPVVEDPVVEGPVVEDPVVEDPIIDLAPVEKIDTTEPIQDTVVEDLPSDEVVTETLVDGLDVVLPLPVVDEIEDV